MSGKPSRRRRLLKIAAAAFAAIAAAFIIATIVAIDGATADALRDYVTRHHAALDRLETAIRNGRLRLPVGGEGDGHDEVYGQLRVAARALCLWSLHEQAQGDADAAVERLVVASLLRRDTAGGSTLRCLTHVAIDLLCHEELLNLYSRHQPSLAATDRAIQSMEWTDFQSEFVVLQTVKVSEEAEKLVELDQYMDSVLSFLPASFREWQLIQQAVQHPYHGDMREDDPLIGVLPDAWRARTQGNLEIDVWLTKWAYRIWPGRWRSIQAHEVRRQLEASDTLAAAEDVGSEPAAHDLDSTWIYVAQETERVVVGCALAIEKYRLEHGSWPRIPDDVALPEGVHFRPLADGVTIYHVGGDGVDDGGVQAGLSIVGGDIAFHLLDPAVRGTLAPPDDDAARP